MKRIALLLVFAFTAPGLFAGPVPAQSLPSLEDFLSVLPGQAVPSPLPPLRAQQYLAQAAGLTGEKLFQFLHEATAYSPAGAGKDYLNSKKYMFSMADNAGCGGGPGVTCLYSQVCAKGASEHGADYKEQGDANGDGTTDSAGMNAEHSWPQGFFNQAAPMRSDLHHIFPTFITPNNTRGSVPFGPVARAEYVTTSGTKFDGSVFEPANPVKGDIARAILYFVVRYYDRNIKDGMSYADFWTGRVPMFLEWDRQDPPDANEIRRNGLIERFQGNRNPFVDDATLVGRVGVKVFQSH
ncbi:MAG: endonuclease [Elusimicrobiota bacterium]|nr:endonuclease [Elusimicrobiota bacterium]